jgi:methyl-galactoside transport system substrate-binding protein
MTVDGEFNQTVQIERIQTMINKGIDALLVNLIDSGSATTIIQMCEDAEIPVCFFNSQDKSEDLVTYKWAWDVSMDNVACGSVAGELAADAFKADTGRYDRNGDGVLQILLVAGPVSEATTLWRNAVVASAEAGGIQAEVQDMQNVKNFSSAGATDVCTAWIGRYGDSIEMIISSTDAMAMGCVEALNANGLITADHAVPVIGKNCLPEVSELIRNGMLYGSILTSPTEIGTTALKIVLNTLNKKDALDSLDYEWYNDGFERKVKTYAIKVTADNTGLAIDAYKTYSER